MFSSGGAQGQLAEGGLAPLEACFQEFGLVDMEFSVGEEGKAVQLASTRWLRDQLRRRLRGLRIAVRDTGLYLGVDLPTRYGAHSGFRSPRPARRMKVTLAASTLILRIWRPNPNPAPHLDPDSDPCCSPYPSSLGLYMYDTSSKIN